MKGTGMVASNPLSPTAYFTQDFYFTEIDGLFSSNSFLYWTTAELDWIYNLSFWKESVLKTETIAVVATYNATNTDEKIFLFYVRPGD